MTHLFCIVDRSGSMTGLEKATISGYNEYVDNLRKEKIKITTVLFEHEQLTITDSEAIKDSPKLSTKNYQPRGTTALIDAVCQTINSGKSAVKKKDKALVLVITDGQENASRENKSKDMRDLIHGLEKQGNWTFTYLGANQDAWETSRDWGFKAGNVADFNATGAGVGATFSAMSVNTRAYTVGAQSATNQFYSKEDKVKLKNAK